MTTDTTSSTDGGQASTSGTGQVPTSTTDDQASVSQKQPAEYERIIAELRKSEAATRTKLNKFEADEVARQQAAMGDLEKAQAKADAAEKQIKQYQEQLVHAEIKLAASGKNIINPDLIADTIFKQLEFEDGKPTNLEKALDELIKSNPYLIKQSEGQTPAQTGAQQGAPNVPAMNPGRTNITQQGTLPTGQTMRLEDIYRQQRQR